jgi:hypothetical protein
MRMALDLGLHRALEKLAETDSVKKRDDEEERDLGTIFPLGLASMLMPFKLSRLASGFAFIGLIISASSFLCVLVSKSVESATE